MAINSFCFGFQSFPRSIEGFLPSFLSHENLHSSTVSKSPIKVEATVESMPGFVPVREEISFSFDQEKNSYCFRFGNQYFGIYSQSEKRLKLHFYKNEKFTSEENDLPRAVSAAFRMFMVNHRIMKGEGLSIHSALGIHEDQAIIFPGPSGVGKSTLSQDFEKVFASADEMILTTEALNTRTPLVAACETRQKTWPQAAHPRTVPLSALAFLEQHPQKTTIAAIGKHEALSRMLGQVVDYSKNPNVMAQIITLAEHIVSSVPAFVVHRNLTDMSADALFFDILKRVRAC